MSSLHRGRPPLSHIHVCDERVLASPRAGNIGVLFDESLNMVPHVTAMCKSAFYHLRKIRLIRKHLTFDAAQLLVQALVRSKLDYCNSLLYGLPKNVNKQLQRLQNAAAGVVTLSSKVCHITPVLANLHWLSIYLWIESKILSMDMILLISKIFFNVTFRYGILGLHKNLLVMPAFNINSYGRRTFSVATPLLWNSLPQHIRHAGSLDFLKDS